MKKVFILLLLIVCGLRATAQIGDHRSEFAIGGNAGYILSNVGFMPEVPQNLHTGLTGGLTVRYTSEKYFSSICAIVGELNYANVGWAEEILTPSDEPVINPETNVAEMYERDITYLQIPVFARLGWGRERRGFQFFFQVGPQVGMYLGEKTRRNYSRPYTKNRTSSVVAQETMSVERRFDYGIAGGIGLEFSNPHVGHFLVEGRYYYGLGDIYGNSKRDYFGRSNLTNIVIKLTYLFDLFKSDNPTIK